MKKTIRLVLILLALGLVLTPNIVSGASAEGTLVVGSTSALTGYFYSELWGNNTADIDVRRLVHGYELVPLTADGPVAANPIAVKDMSVTQDADGNTVYTIQLNDNLVYSDGTAITAKDYALNFLLQHHPLTKQLGANPRSAKWLLGGEAFGKGDSQTLAGLRLLGDKTLSVTVSKDALPDYIEGRYLNIHPVPPKVLIPDLDLVDEGEGVMIKGDLSLEMLKKTLMDEQTGYLSHPSPASGPYVLTSYTAGVATFTKNARFLGTAQGHVPTIDKVDFTLVKNDSALAQLKAGRVHLINKASETNLVDGALAAGFAPVPYDRTGLAFITFNFGSEAVKDIAVRRAIARSVDRLLPGQALAGDRAQSVDGFYGLGQWMAKRYVTEGKDQLPIYPMDAAQVKADLAAVKMPLALKLAIPQDNKAAAAMADQLLKALKPHQVELTVVTLPWTELLAQYYGKTDKGYDLAFMATNFFMRFDPTDLVEAGPFAEADEDGELLAAARDMRMTVPDDNDGYYAKWLTFQQLVAEKLPVIPLYTNMYVDLVSPKLAGYDLLRGPSWADAILGATFAP